MNKTIIRYLIFLVVVISVSCKEDEIEVYHGPDAINLFVEVNKKQVNSAQVPLGFLNDEIQDSTINLIANIQGVTAMFDRVVKLEIPDSVEAVIDVNYSFVKESILKAGQTTVKIPFKIKRTGLINLNNGMEIIVTVAQSSDFSAGVKPSVSIIATDAMPTQWIGYTMWFPYYFGVCTKTKYKFVYETLGIYDFTSVGSDYNVLKVYKNYLNSKLDEYEIIHGARLWDVDLNKNVIFP